MPIDSARGDPSSSDWHDDWHDDWHAVSD
jgi:hypothetical protein